MPHNPTPACEADHCSFHNEDEPSLASTIVCGECGHAFQDVQALARQDAVMRSQVGMPPLAIIGPIPEGPDLFRLFPVCPFCSHDF